MRDELGFVAGLIAQAGVDYAVIGGHAVNAWLEPRFTADIDVTIVTASERRRRFRYPSYHAQA